MKIVVAGDIHFPHQDDKVIELFYKFIKDQQPDTIVFNGDLLDFSGISKFASIPGTSNLGNEISLCWQFLSDVRMICPNARIVYITGNHEWRWRSQLIENIKDPTMYGIIKERTYLSDLLQLNKLNIEFKDLPENISRFDDNYIYLEGFFIGHWNRVSKHSDYTVKNLIDDKGVSVIQGHTHRLGVFYKKTLSKTLIGVETGCLCKTEPDYCMNPNWESGWAIIENKNVYTVHIEDYEFDYAGKHYDLDYLRPVMIS